MTEYLGALRALRYVSYTMFSMATEFSIKNGYTETECRANIWESQGSESGSIWMCV